jgi:uncharacterized protein YegP (UPF0339 family)
VRFEVYEAADGWRWRVVAANGKKTGSSHEAFASKRNAVRAVRAFAKSCFLAWLGGGVIEVDD